MITYSVYCFTYRGVNRKSIRQGEKYIGFTKNFKLRFNQHLKDRRSNRRFHGLLRKHLSEFEICFIERNIVDVDEAKKIEVKCIAYYDCYHNGLNETLGGDGFTGCHQEQTKRAIGHAVKDRYKNPIERLRTAVLTKAGWNDQLRAEQSIRVYGIWERLNKEERTQRMKKAWVTRKAKKDRKND